MTNCRAQGVSWSESKDLWICCVGFRGQHNSCLECHSHTNYVTSVTFSPDGRHIVSGSAGKTISIWDADADQQVLGPALSMQVTCPPGEKNTVLSRKTDSSWNEGSSTLHRGFSLDHSNGWATSQHLTDSATGSKTPLLFWAPPHNRRGICGSETIIIMETPLNRIDFSRFIHGSSWAQCYLLAPTMKRTLSPLPPDLFEGQALSLWLRILVLLAAAVAAAGILHWLGDVLLGLWLF
jgi:WD40 repeat protein